MIVLDETGRVDEVRAPNGIKNVVDGDASGQKARRFRGHLEFGDTPTLNEDGGDAIESIHARLEVVGGDFPELILGNGVGGQAVAENGESGEGEAVRFDLSSGRQF